MAALIRKFIEGYHYINDDLADPRTAHFPMVSTPLPMILIIIVYNVFVQCIGPRWMKNRKAYNLKILIVAYDVLQIFTNTWLLFRVLSVTYFSGKYSFICQPIGTGTTPQEIVIMECTYQYFLTKILDLLDTVFFILTKKSSHLSFLHLYHHSGMVACGWIGIKYVPGGQAIFFGAINGFVHAVMYTYYLLSALKIIDSRHIFWKKSLTKLQMVQFALIFFHQLLVVLNLNPDCNFPRFISMMVLPQNFFIFILFADFYRRTYLTKKEKTV